MNGGINSSILSVLQEIYALLLGVFGLGGSLAQTDVFATVSTTPICLYPQSQLIKRGLIQNLSTTDEITVFATPGGKTAAAITAGLGTILNPAPGTGEGGGTMPLGNIDLASLTFISSTNANQSVSVYYEK